MRPFLAALSLSAALLGLSPAALAEPTRTLESARIQLGQIAETTDAELAAVDLGASPPPGSSRLISREDVMRELRAQGLEQRKLSFPPVLRVVSASRRYSPSELSALLLPEVNAALPPGVTLKELKAPRALVTAPHVTVGRIKLPKLARRAGPVDLTLVADLMHDGAVLTRVAFGLAVDVSEQAAAPLVDKGARVDLVILTGSARISASAVALEPADVGDVVSFKVSTTQRVLRARLESRTQAQVVSQ
ncbi:MAG TPA: flagella basal body P-ring formation protein FlgA [Polyangiaceae bacterium]|nr:flagella basal body P-ring formation protein FlgA [Polyangiaceae bacterium]